MNEAEYLGDVELFGDEFIYDTDEVILALTRVASFLRDNEEYGDDWSKELDAIQITVGKMYEVGCNPAPIFDNGTEGKLPNPCWRAQVAMMIYNAMCQGEISLNDEDYRDLGAFLTPSAIAILETENFHRLLLHIDKSTSPKCGSKQ